MDEVTKNADETAVPETAAAADAPAEQKADAAAEPADAQTDADAAPDGEEKGAEAPAAPAEPDWKDRYARAMADFDNFRKRTARDREDLVKFAASDVIKDVLATVDNLARALEGVKDKADDPFVKGVRLVYDGLLKTLADHGATPLDALGEPFDANYHEALAQLPSDDVEAGHVMNEVARGWLLHGRLLRAAKVVVSAGKGA